MTRIKLKFSLLLIAVLFLSCRKRISSDSIYVGEWGGSHSICQDHIIVTPQSTATYFIDGNGNECEHGDTLIFSKFEVSKKSFTIGGTKFKLVEGPTAMDTVQMQVGNENVRVFGRMTIIKPVLMGSARVEMFKIKR